MRPILMLSLMLCLLLLLTACDSGSNQSLSTDIGTDNKNGLLLNTSHGGGGAAWGLARCDACHVTGLIHKNANNNIRQMVQAKGVDSCAGCHGTNGSDIKRQCLICHNANDLADAPIQTASHQHDFNASADNVLQDQQCLSCHYASDMDGVFENNRDLTRYADENGIETPYSSGSDFCLRCHNRDHQQTDFPIVNKSFDDALIAIEDSYTRVDKHGVISSSGMGTYAGLRSGYSYSSRVECTDCHALHGTDNIKLIIDRSDKGVSKLDSAIIKQPHSVAISGGDYSQLCVLCHAMETLQNQGDIDTGNGLSGVHLTGTSCIECHSHGEAIQAGL